MSLQRSQNLDNPILWFDELQSPRDCLSFTYQIEVEKPEEG